MSGLNDLLCSGQIRGHFFTLRGQIGGVGIFELFVLTKTQDKCGIMAV